MQLVSYPPPWVSHILHIPGTVEWLPGSPLGNSGYSWSDVLLADMPNVYVYAANNPSESIVAKRRGCGAALRPFLPPCLRILPVFIL